MPQLLNDIQEFGAAATDISAEDYLATSGLTGRALTLGRYTLSAHTPGKPRALSIKGFWSDAIVD